MNGLPGRSGGSAGNVLVVTNNLQLNGNSLTILANGGNGGTGQDGGDGYDGRDGRDVQNTPYQMDCNDSYFNCISVWLEKQGFKFSYVKTIKSTFHWQYKYRLYGEDGEKGSNGGDGGKGGRAGITIFYSSKMKTYNVLK